MNNSLILTPLTGIPLIFPGDDLAEIIQNSLKEMKLNIESGDIIVLAQKIVSKSEGRIVNLNAITPSPEATEYAKSTEKDPRLVELILRESTRVIRVRPGTIIVEHRLGFVCANAGIDHSNVGWGWNRKDLCGSENEQEPPEEWVLLLPENPDNSARGLREIIERNSNQKIGVMIIDSHGRTWRMGTVGVTIGLSGLPGLVDLRGEKDIFGYKLRITQIGAADELAGAASLVMGQSSERVPIVHVRGFPYSLRESALSELIRPKELDMFK